MGCSGTGDETTGGTTTPDYGVATAAALRATASALGLGLAESLSIGVLELDGDCSVLYANDPARRSLELADAVLVDDGRLEARRTADRIRLRRWLGDVTGRTTPRPLVLPRATGRVPYLLMHASSTIVDADLGKNTHLLLLVDPQAPPQVDPEVLAEVFGLTRAESAVAAAVARGDSLREFSARVGIAEGTARRHLERIFLKTGVERQAQLVRLVLACTVPLRVAAADDTKQRQVPQ